MRFVKIAASYAIPATRSSSRACDVVSRTAAALPAARIAASVAWSSGAPGVVTCASWRSRRSPTLVSTVPMSPVEMPAASRAATARNEVVVLPSVPVIPTTPSSRDGSPAHQPAAWARAALEPATTTCGIATLVDGPLDDGRRGPGGRRPRDEVVAVHVEPRHGDEQRPGPHRARVLGHATDADAGEIVGGHGAPPVRASRTSPAAARRSRSEPSGLGSRPTAASTRRSSGVDPRAGRAHAPPLPRPIERASLVVTRPAA